MSSFGVMENTSGNCPFCHNTFNGLGACPTCNRYPQDSMAANCIMPDHKSIQSACDESTRRNIEDAMIQSIMEKIQLPLKEVQYKWPRL